MKSGLRRSCYESVSIGGVPNVRVLSLQDDGREVGEKECVSNVSRKKNWSRAMAKERCENEKKFPCSVFWVRAYCNCGGEWRFTGISQPVSRPNYCHKCNGCQEIEYFKVKYPRQQLDIGALEVPS